MVPLACWDSSLGRRSWTTLCDWPVGNVAVIKRAGVSAGVRDNDVDYWNHLTWLP